jgi:hypothetical protein
MAENLVIKLAFPDKNGEEISGRTVNAGRSKAHIRASDDRSIPPTTGQLTGRICY